MRLLWRTAVPPSVPWLNRSALVGLEPQRSVLVLVLVLSQVYYDHLGLGLELPWRSAWSQAPPKLYILVFNVRAARARRSGVFTNLSFPAQSCISLPVDHLDIGLLHLTAQPLGSFVALASAGSPIVCASSSLALPASCIVGSATSSIAGSSSIFHGAPLPPSPPRLPLPATAASTALLRPARRAQGHHNL